MLAMADFSQPGSEGQLPEGFEDWRWGVVYTVHGDMRGSLERGREYSTMAMVRRRIARGEEFHDFAELYGRAARIAAARAAAWGGLSWIAKHGWGAFGEKVPFAYAAVRRGVLHPSEGQEVPAGLETPSASDLAQPNLPPRGAIAQPGEVYNDFDFRDPAQPLSTICIFSYGEMVASHRRLPFEPFVERAERLAEAHRDLLDPGSAGKPLAIVRREWMWATNPDVAVVHVYFDAGMVT